MTEFHVSIQNGSTSHNGVVEALDALSAGHQFLASEGERLASHGRPLAVDAHVTSVRPYDAAALHVANTRVFTHLETDTTPTPSGKYHVYAIDTTGSGWGMAYRARRSQALAKMRVLGRRLALPVRES